jgi:outer membrane protein TolC
MKCNFKVQLLLVTLVCSSAFSQKFSLFEAQNYALDNAEQLKNAAIDVEIAQKKIVETRAIGLPQISAEGNFNHFINYFSIYFSINNKKKLFLFLLLIKNL